MPRLKSNGIRTLSLFSGGGGLDLGFDLAGFSHLSSYDVLDFAGDTLRANRPGWDIQSGKAGNVLEVDWAPYRGRVDLIHGGPPCQPFSIAGRRKARVISETCFPNSCGPLKLSALRSFSLKTCWASSRKYLQLTVRSFLRSSANHISCLHSFCRRRISAFQDRRRTFVGACGASWKEIQSRVDRAR